MIFFAYSSEIDERQEESYECNLQTGETDTYTTGKVIFLCLPGWVLNDR